VNRDVNEGAAVRAAVTLSLVPEVRGGPFVFWDETAPACEAAARIGFDGIELFPSAARAVPVAAVRAALDGNGLALAAVGTGAGGVVHGLSLAHPDPAQRQRAVDFVRAIIELAAPFDAPAIVGSMQGRSANGEPREEALARLADSLAQLAEHAVAAGGRVLLEPLNRYETDLCNTLQQGSELLARIGSERIALLADLFHMNIEEHDIAAALGAAAAQLGHLHFVDSNRRPAGCGHLAYAPIAAALRAAGYRGWASAEAFPYPEPEAAARQTIYSYRAYLEGLNR
jgi:sugar phosphate isomerase/epimerase